MVTVQRCLALRVNTEMPVCVFEWASSTADSKDVADTAVFPVYLNSNRSEFMFSVELDVDPAVKSESYALRSIALVASSLKDAMALILIIIHLIYFPINF